MSLPAPHEPAFIVDSKLGADAEYSSKATSDLYLTSSPDSRPDSRSTSAGSLSPLPSSAEADINCSLPDYDYPVPLFVRNTFIDTPVPRPISLDEFLEDRRIHSCPVASPPGFGSEVAGLPTACGQRPAGNSLMDSAIAAAASASAAVAAATRCWMAASMQGQVHCQTMPASPPSTNLSVGPQAPPVLRLAEMLEEPELGSPELPTVGSAGHFTGSCKPCAFYHHAKGCSNGTDCPFCHLCPAGEKKRRQKEKGAIQREMQRMGH